MQSLKDDYVNYENSLRLRELGFDHLCYTSYTHKGQLMNPFSLTDESKFFENSESFVRNSDLNIEFVSCTAPLISQVCNFLESNGVSIEKKMTLDWKHMFFIRLQDGTVANYVDITKNRNRGYNKAIKQALICLNQ